MQAQQTTHRHPAVAVDLDLGDLPHFGSEIERNPEIASAVSRFHGRLLAAFEKSRLEETTRRSLLRTATRALLCPDCGPGNIDPARLIQAYALVHLVGCSACVKRYTGTALAQGFTHDQLEAVLTLVSGLQATAILLHARSAETARPGRRKNVGLSASAVGKKPQPRRPNRSGR